MGKARQKYSFDVSERLLVGKAARQKAARWKGCLSEKLLMGKAALLERLVEKACRKGLLERLVKKARRKGLLERRKGL